MSKLSALLGVVIVGVAVYFAFIYKSCKEPNELQVQLTALNCARALITPELRVEACRDLGREDECEFQPEDAERVQEFVLNKVLSCAKASLAKEGYCTDKLQEQLR